MLSVVDRELAQITADHLSRPTLRFLRAVADGRANIQSGVVESRTFTTADWTDLDDLTADELLDEQGSVTDFGAAVLRFAPDDEPRGDGCGT